MNPSLFVSDIRERDITLLLLEEFWSSDDFRQWCAKRTLPSKHALSHLVSVRCLAMEPDGESDLEVAFATVNGEIRLLIENKIDAPFQLRQVERYGERGRRYVEQGKCAEFYTVLVAPKRYFGGADDLKGFDSQRTYELVQSWFREQGSIEPRRLYKAELLQAAIKKAASSYQRKLDADVTSFWQAYWEMAREHAPELQMKLDPRGAGPRSGFINFNPVGLPTGVQLLHKILSGKSSQDSVDLQFNRMGERMPELRRAFTARIDPDIEFARANGSGSIRLCVPKLDIRADFAPQAKNALEGIRAAKRLAAWILKHQTLINDRASAWGLTKRPSRSVRIG
jgi:hypothetical protein